MQLCVVLVACGWTIVLVGSVHLQNRHSTTDHPAGKREANGDSAAIVGNEVISGNTSGPLLPSRTCVLHESTKNTKPPYTLDTLERIHDAIFGRLRLNYTSRPQTIWRLICARDPQTRERGTLSIVLMTLNTTIGDYVQIKSKRLQGCSSTYRGFVFNKRSILVGYVPSPHTEGGELELGYVCIKSSMRTLATSLFNRRPMEHIQNEDMFERVAGLLREGEEGLLTIGSRDPELRRVIDLAQSSPRRREHPADTGSGDTYLD